MLQMYIGLKVMYRYFCQIALKIYLLRQIFGQTTNTEFHRNPCREPICFLRTNRRTDGHDEGNNDFRNFAKASKTDVTN